MRWTVVALLGLLAVPGVASADSGDAADKVEEGVRHYSAGDYQAAAAAFAEADVARPDDPRITFDRACAYAASGDVDKAVELFQKAALAQEPGLAVRCHYNRGRIAADKARAVFGEAPEEAPAETRQQGLQLLIQAVGHFRDCIDMQPDHADARHNLEVIRLWIKHMESIWQKRDRQKKRDEMNLLQFLLFIDAQQRGLRDVGKSLLTQTDSPMHRQALSVAADSQRTLAEEIGPLKDKLTQAVVVAPQTAGQAAGGPASGMPGPGPSPSSQPEGQQAAEALNTLADEVAQAMLSAASQLDGRRPADAVESQTEAVEKLDGIYRALVPYPQLLKRAVDTQQGLVDRATPAGQTSDDPADRTGDGTAEKTPAETIEKTPAETIEKTPAETIERTPAETAEKTPGGQSPDEQVAEDAEQSAWTQQFVAGWSGSLVPKAEQGLKRLDSRAPAAAGQAAGKDPQQAEADAQAKKQIEGLRQSMQRALKLGPKVQALAAEAASDIGQRRPDDALPKQQQALKLLKEIAEPLSKQQQQDKDQNKKQQKQDQKKDQDKDEPQKKEQQQQKQQQKKPQDLSKEQAKALLRKVRRRQDERQKLKRQARQFLGSPAKVERDW